MWKGFAHEVHVVGTSTHNSMVWGVPTLHTKAIINLSKVSGTAVLGDITPQVGPGATYVLTLHTR